jgi:hypothetical protein
VLPFSVLVELVLLFIIPHLILSFEIHLDIKKCRTGQMEAEKYRPKSHRRLLTWFDSNVGLKKLFLVVSGVLVFCYCTWTMSSYVHQRSYLWQSTVLNDMLHGSIRQNCVPYIPSTGAVVEAKKGIKTGMLMLFSGGESAWDPKLMKRVVKNREVYCRLHNCDIIVANDMIDKSRPPAWSKLLVARKYVTKYDYLMYLDMDMVILNFNRSLLDYALYARSLSQKSQEANVGGSVVDYDFVMSKDWSGPNTGAFIVRNSSWSLKFFEDAWKLGEDMVKPKTKDGKSYPFQYEQRVFHYMLDTDVWRSRKLPAYPHTEEVKRHFLILPQCSMNSYAVHPFEHRANRSESQYVPGDFLIHFPGKAPQNKFDLMSYYLDIAEKTYPN